MLRPPRLCWYCGKPGSSKEHIWGKWTQKALKDVSKKTAHTVSRIRNYHPYIETKKGVLHRDGAPRSQTTSGVCASCNNGPLRKIAESAAPHLIRLRDDSGWELSADNRRELAAWITMVIMNFESADRATAASTPEDRAHLIATGEPPAGWTIWVGRYEGLGWSERIFHRATVAYQDDDPLPNRPNGQGTIFTFGSLLIHCISAPEWLEFRTEVYGQSVGLAQVWPITLGDFKRPYLYHDDLSLELLTTQIVTAPALSLGSEATFVRTLRAGELKSSPVYSDDNVRAPIVGKEPNR